MTRPEAADPGTKCERRREAEIADENTTHVSDPTPARKDVRNSLAIGHKHFNAMDQIRK